MFNLLFGYTVCTITDDGYKLSIALHKGNAIFKALAPHSVPRIRKSKTDDTELRYAYIPHLLYVKVESFKQLDQLKNGLIVDEIAPKKRIACVLQQLDSGKFAPYTLKSYKRYTKQFQKPTLYEPLDAQLLSLHSWFYSAPLTEEDEPIFAQTFERVTKQPLSAISDALLMQQLLRLETTDAVPLTSYVLDLRKYAHNASYVSQELFSMDDEVATGCELIVNASARSNALLVKPQMLQQLLAHEDVIVPPPNAIPLIKEALHTQTGPFANKLLVIGDMSAVQAWIHVDSALPLAIDEPLQLATTQYTENVSIKKLGITAMRKYGFIDPFAFTNYASVTTGQIATVTEAAYIDSLMAKHAISAVTRVDSTFPIAENVVLFHPQHYMPHYAQLVTYEQPLQQAIEPLLNKQPPLRQSVYYDTLHALTNELPPVATIAQPASEQHTPFYRMLAAANITLNDAQQQAVEAVTGPVLILAGAGSGKTTTLISRIAYMIEEHHIAPQHILLVTFTKKAAQEMKERLLRLPNGRSYSSLTVGTYHAICLRILREQGREFQLLASEAAKHFRFKMILKKLGLADDYTPEAVMSIVSNWKNRMLRPVDVKKQAEALPKTKVDEKAELFALAKIYDLYEQEKEARNELDFDDFLLEVYYLLTYDEQVRAYYQQRFQYVLCDEFQDVSTIQYELTRLLAAPTNNLCIVGDDNQTIYSWRAASSSFMLDFKKRYPAATKVKLETNYRSTADIVGFSNALIAHNQKQIKKVLNVPTPHRHPIYVEVSRTPEEEAATVLDEIQQLHYNGMPYKNIVVLTRSATYMRTLFEYFVLHEIPVIDFSKQGESFYDDDYIKRFIAAMRVSLNPNDAEAIALLGKLLYMQQEAWVQLIVREQHAVSNTSLFERVMRHMATQKQKPFQQEAIKRQLQAILRYRHQSPVDVLNDLRTGTINCEKQLDMDAKRTKTLHKEEIRERFDEFETSLRRFRTIEAFIQFLMRLQQKQREMEAMKSDPTIDAVHVMTIHSAKGLEYDAVFAIGWFEGMLPHFKALSTDEGLLADDFLPPDEALEEERRLAYVCATRAKERLYISSVRTYHQKPRKLSRFLIEGATSE